MELTVNEQKTVDRAFKIINKHSLNTKHFLSSTQLTKNYFRLKLSGQTNESFEVAFLDSQYALLGTETLALGTIDAAHVYVRVVAQRALLNNAAAVVLAHNHPSGSLEPSDGDINITHKLQEALGLFEIKILDHIIVGHGVVSMAELGLIKEM